MPLVIICGRPCTGKTTFSNKLADEFRARSEDAVVVNEESIGCCKLNEYRSSTQEKDIRGALKGGVDHSLTANTFVIVDSLNYIKGFRYELYCCARALRTPHCVVWVACDENDSNLWNANRLAHNEDGYDITVMNELRARFEAPNDANRWDCPLFKVTLTTPSKVVESDSANNSNTNTAQPSATSKTPVVKSSWKPKKAINSESSNTDKSSNSGTQTSDVQSDPKLAAGTVWFSGSAPQAREDLSSFSSPDKVIEEIYQFLRTAQAPIPNSSTVAPTHVQADSLYELDRISQRIVHLLVNHQAEQPEGTPLHLVDFNRSFTLHRHVSMGELQRLRGQWVKVNAHHPMESANAAGSSFVDFLAANL